MILIIGSNGQLGTQMQKKLSATGKRYCALDYPDVDITNMNSLSRLIAHIKPRTIVNCAAYTNVDKAETEPEAVYAVNALGPRNLARLCNAEGIELMHVSTDYVFDGEPIVEGGQPRPYVETDPCAPATVYGKTKLEGETFVQSECDKWYILRTAWLYGEGANFVRTMLKLAETNDTLRVVDDQIGSPTSTVEMAEAICTMIVSGRYGLYHATCEGQCSWFEFARKIFSLAGVDIRVEAVSSAEFLRPAKRPNWSVLENARLKEAGINTFRHWEDALSEYLLAENVNL